MNKRLLAISDIHGHYDKFVELLKIVNYNPKEDQLILCGDYIDRGNDNIKTLLLIDELINNGAIALIGNHEDMFKMLLNKNMLHHALFCEEYIDLGMNNTVKDFYRATEHERFIISKLLNNKLLPYYEYGNWIFVHAGINANVSIDENSIENLIWSREKFYMNKAYDNKIIIFGHTPTFCIHNNSGIWRDEEYNDKIGIDCGCSYKDGKLCCFDISNNIEYYI